MDNKTKILCEKNNIEIMARWCAARWRRANQIKLNTQDVRAVPFDLGCRVCDQGKAVANGKYKTTKKAPKKEVKPMKEQTKICSDPNCKMTGKPQPLSNFHKDKTGALGRRSKCIECEKRLLKERKQNNYPANGKMKIILDFANRQEIFEKVRELANNEMRPVNMQCIWLIKKGLSIE